LLILLQQVISLWKLKNFFVFLKFQGKHLFYNYHGIKAQKNKLNGNNLAAIDSSAKFQSLFAGVWPVWVIAAYHDEKREKSLVLMFASVFSVAI
jgi:hypothetical protein